MKREAEKLNGELTKVQREISSTEARISMLEQRARELSTRSNVRRNREKRLKFLRSTAFGCRITSYPRLS